MKSSEKNIKNLDSAFENLFESYENDYENEAKIIASKILSGISVIADKKDLKRKNIADLIGTSASYLTQLYRGNKILNLVTLAKLKNKLDFNIEIKITENNYENLNSDYYFKKLNIERNKTDWIVFKNITSEDSEPFTNGNNNSMKIIKQQLTA